jgi:hypothetical protein
MTDKIYECGCGGQTFFLHQDGQVECVECNCFINDISVDFPNGIPDSEERNA